MTFKPYSIEDVALVCKNGAPPYSLNGYVIGADATIYALTDRFYHGVVIAVLYPELAAEKGVAPPGSPRDDIDVFEYQRFELDNSRELPIIRISVSMSTGTTLISKGHMPATEEQIDALSRVFKTLGLSARHTLTGDEDDQTVGEFLEQLRQERLEKPADPESYVLQPPEDF